MCKDLLVQPSSPWGKHRWDDRVGGQGGPEPVWRNQWEQASRAEWHRRFLQMSQQRYKHECKGRNTKYSEHQTTVALWSHHMGHNNLAPQWWRDQVDTAGGGWVGHTQVCTLLPQTLTQVRSRWGRMKGGNRGANQQPGCHSSTRTVSWFLGLQCVVTVTV